GGHAATGPTVSRRQGEAKSGLLDLIVQLDQDGQEAEARRISSKLTDRERWQALATAAKELISLAKRGTKLPTERARQAGRRGGVESGVARKKKGQSAYAEFRRYYQDAMSLRGMDEKSAFRSAKKKMERSAKIHAEDRGIDWKTLTYSDRTYRRWLKDNRT